MIGRFQQSFRHILHSCISDMNIVLFKYNCVFSHAEFGESVYFACKHTRTRPEYIRREFGKWLEMRDVLHMVEEWIEAELVGLGMLWQTFVSVRFRRGARATIR